MRICQSCGTKVAETAKFCDQCGIKLIETQNNNTDQISQNKTEIDNSDQKSPDQTKKKGKLDLGELDLTALDKKAVEGKISEEHLQDIDDKNKEIAQKDDASEKVKKIREKIPKQSDNIINLNEVLESDEKVELDNSSIKREVLADDEVLSKICPMCGEELQLNKQLLENTPVIVKCLKCGNETKIW